MKRPNPFVSLPGLALIASSIEPDPEIALIPITNEGKAVSVPRIGPLPAPMSTNLYTRAGRGRAKIIRELTPGVDTDTIKGMLRNEADAWDRAEGLARKAGLL
jgi:hypothetical protein